MELQWDFLMGFDGISMGIDEISSDLMYLILMVTSWDFKRIWKVTRKKTGTAIRWEATRIGETHHLMDGDIMILNMCLKMEPPKKHLNRYLSFFGCFGIRICCR